MNVVSHVKLGLRRRLCDADSLLHLGLRVVVLLLGILPQQFARNEFLLEELARLGRIWLARCVASLPKPRLRNRHAVHDGQRIGRQSCAERIGCILCGSGCDAAEREGRRNGHEDQDSGSHCLLRFKVVNQQRVSVIEYRGVAPLVRAHASSQSLFDVYYGTTHPPSATSRVPWGSAKWTV